MADFWVLIMNYKIIDIDNWQRKEYFEHYLKTVPCTYSITTKLDITNIKSRNLKLYPALLYCLTKTVNKHEQFRTALRADGRLVVYDFMHPCYTVFHKDSKTFSNIWTEFCDDYNAFCRRYNGDILRYGDKKGFMTKPDMPENVFTVSMLPWITFDGFNLNIKSFDYLLPIFTVGRYEQVNGKYIIPLAVQVHHSVCDGYHASCFITDLQKEIECVV